MHQHKIKLSDYLIKFIENLGVKYAFLIPGGGNIHIIDSIGKSKKIKYICNQHEQASAIAAEAYSRISENIGVCIVTTGPGGTNAITGILGAWLDSIPMLVISGQIKREMIAAGKSLRQLGDQEINIVDIVKPITKYAILVDNPYEIKYHLEKAVYLAKEGRPGPVWIDIPLDVQGSFIDIGKLKKFDPVEIKLSYKRDKKYLEKVVAKTIEKLQKAKRPVLYIGNGVRLAGGVKSLLQLIELLKIPVLTSFAGYDILGTDNPYFFGRPGTVGQRHANFILQNSDLLLSIGARLNVRMIGYNYQSFAREAYKIMVDIDERELHKKTIRPDLAINCDAKAFIKEMIKQLLSGKIQVDEWLERGHLYQEKYPLVKPEYWKERKYVNYYCFIAILSKYLRKTDIIAVSDGTACVAPYQALTFPQGVRIVVNSGCASMGYGLPSAIGACFAKGKRDTICFEGDGSIQLNIQELQTVVYHKLPIKIFIFTNDGYISIRLTQKTFFGGKFVAADKKSGVSCPDFIKIAKAYGIKHVKISNHQEMEKKIKKVLTYDGPVVCVVELSPEMEFLPKASSRQLPDGSFVSRPLEDMYPFLPHEELKENMIIELWDEK